MTRAEPLCGADRLLYPGRHRFVPGPFGAAPGPQGAREIVRVRHCRPDQLTDRDARELGFRTRAQLIARLGGQGAGGDAEVTLLALAPERVTTI